VPGVGFEPTRLLGSPV